MPHIWIRPDMRTDGGESSDIIVDGKYAGNITLVYREGRRMSGTVQLDGDMLSDRHKEAVIAVSRKYVHSLVDACGAAECDVVVNVGRVEQVIAAEGREEWPSRLIGEYPLDADTEADYIDQRDSLDDVGQESRDHLALSGSRRRRGGRRPERKADRTERSDAVFYELMIVGENRDSVEYHIYDRQGRAKKLLAEVFATVKGREVTGEINWLFRPSDFQIENAADLLVSDFNEDEIDYFLLEMKHDGELLDTIELLHDDLLDDVEAADGEPLYGEGLDDDVSVVLSRDDGDTLTYDIYRQSKGGLPVASATIDISRRELSGFVDFHEPSSEEEREEIAVRLVYELDKEKSYESFNLTMLENNEWVDEITFENDTVQ